MKNRRSFIMKNKVLAIIMISMAALSFSACGLFTEETTVTLTVDGTQYASDYIYIRYKVDGTTQEDMIGISLPWSTTVSVDDVFDYSVEFEDVCNTDTTSVPHVANLITATIEYKVAQKAEDEYQEGDPIIKDTETHQRTTSTTYPCVYLGVNVNDDSASTY